MYSTEHKCSFPNTSINNRILYRKFGKFCPDLCSQFDSIAHVSHGLPTTYFLKSFSLQNHCIWSKKQWESDWRNAVSIVITNRRFWLRMDTEVSKRKGCLFLFYSFFVLLLLFSLPFTVVILSTSFFPIFLFSILNQFFLIMFIISQN